MPQCCVPGCKNGAPNYKTQGNYPSFPFPDEGLSQRKEWIEKINHEKVDNKIWKPTKNSRVCARHFEPDQIIKSWKDKQGKTHTKWKLVEGAILSKINLPFLINDYELAEQTETKIKENETTKDKKSEDIIKSKCKDNSLQFRHKTITVQKCNSEIDSPWSITSIFELCYFKCPDCTYENSSKQTFINHACEIHPEAIKHLSKIKDGSLGDIICPWENTDNEIQNLDSIDDSKKYPHDNDGNEKDQEKVFFSKLLKKKPKLFKTNKSINLKVITKNLSGNDSLKHMSANANPKNEDIQIQFVHENKKMCDKCGNEFQYNEDLKTHICAIKKFKCFSCEDKEFNNPGELQKHLNSVHEGVKIHTSLRKHACDKCNQRFFDAWSLKRHVSVVHEEKERCTCKICEKSFKYKTQLNRHVTYVHEGKKFQCHECGKGLASKSSLKIHIVSHYGVKYHHCHICPLSFTQSSALKRHITIIHEGRKKYKCDICGQSFGQSNNLKQHLVNSHLEDKNFECEKCNYRCKNIWTLKSHVAHVHEGVPWKKTKKSTNKMTNKKHEKKLKEKVHQCDKCEKAFSWPSKLKEHLKVHEGNKQKRQLRPKTHPCRYCSKSFSRPDNLNTHIIAVHQGIKNFKCYECGKAFGYSGDIKKHMKNIHGGHVMKIE